ncbi:MAG TPA: protein kinase [Candidatus Saccharimonadales bacterium]|nr:protein kinase [Candidatus Saccharimonadales bacterium]
MQDRLIGRRYRLLDAHAVGGMASIWRARDETTGDVVAVKRLHPHLLDDDAARERLAREADVMQALHHPNIVGVRDLVADRDDPALVMDFVPGRTSADRLDEDGRVPEPEALAITAAVADALAAAHDRGIVHRDVKPANILLGDDGVVRLADFGIAQVDAVQGDGLTEADGVVGTLRYLAPERLTGSPATPASDVWALGAVLVELITGVPAAPAPTVAERVAAATDPVPRPVGVSDPTWALASRALAPDPQSRDVDAAAMAAALHEAAGTSPDHAMPGGVDRWADTQVVPAQPSRAQRVETGRRRAQVGGDRRPAMVVAAAFALTIAVVAIAAPGGDPFDRSAAGPNATHTTAPAPTADATVTPGPTADPTPAPAKVQAGGRKDTDAGKDKDPGKGKDGGKGKGKQGDNGKGKGH